MTLPPRENDRAGADTATGRSHVAADAGVATSENSTRSAVVRSSAAT